MHAWRLCTDNPAAFVWIFARMETKLSEYIEKMVRNSLQETEMKWNQMDDDFIFTVTETNKITLK